MIMLSQSEDNNNFHRRRLLKGNNNHHWWCRTSTFYSRRRFYHFLGYVVCAIASLAILFITIANPTTTTTTRHHHAYYQHKHPRDVAVGYSAENIVAATFGTTNIDVIEKKNDDADMTATSYHYDDAHLYPKRVNSAQDRLELRERGKDDTYNHYMEEDYGNVTQVVISTDHHGEPHNYGILLTHYHKTGYVLSRHLMQLVVDLEYASHGMSSPVSSNNATTNQWKGSIQKLKAIDHIDKNTGVQIAFGQRGNWKTSFVPARRHSAITGCPPFFTLDFGAVHVQESPDLFCDDDELYRLLFGIGGGGISWNELLQRHSTGSHGNLLSSSSQNGLGSVDAGHNAVSSGKGGVKIVHFVRNPFEMALSNYLYHSQELTVSSTCLHCA